MGRGNNGKLFLAICIIIFFTFAMMSPRRVDNLDGIAQTNTLVFLNSTQRFMIVCFFTVYVSLARILSYSRPINWLVSVICFSVYYSQPLEIMQSRARCAVKDTQSALFLLYSNVFKWTVWTISQDIFIDGVWVCAQRNGWFVIVNSRTLNLEHLSKTTHKRQCLDDDEKTRSIERHISVYRNSIPVSFYRVWILSASHVVYFIIFHFVLCRHKLFNLFWIKI